MFWLLLDFATLQNHTQVNMVCSMKSGLFGFCDALPQFLPICSRNNYCPLYVETITKPPDEKSLIAEETRKGEDELLQCRQV